MQAVGWTNNQTTMIETIMKGCVPMDTHALGPAEVLDRYPAHEDTIPSLLASRSAAIASQPVLRFESRRWSYSQLDEATAKLARFLWARGVSPRERFAHVAPNSDLTVILYFALAKIGAVFAPMNVELTDDDLAYMIRHSGAVGVAGRRQDTQRLESIAADTAAPPCEHAGFAATGPSGRRRRSGSRHLYIRHDGTSQRRAAQPP
jgi:fatty-acyl-CoA synthase